MIAPLSVLDNLQTRFVFNYVGLFVFKAVIVPGVDKIRLLDFGADDLLKFFIIGAKHGNIDVVIPRNETSVSHCAEECAAVSKPADIVLFTDSVKFGNKIQLNIPKFFFAVT